MLMEMRCRTRRAVIPVVEYMSFTLADFDVSGGGIEPLDAG